MTTRIPRAVIVDTRDPERTAWCFPDSVEVIRAALPAGDYTTPVLAPDPKSIPYDAIERKSASDFIGTFFTNSERRERQFERLRSLRRRALIVEADLAHVLSPRIRGGVNPNAIIGTLASLVTRHACPVLFADSPEMAARLALGILVRWEEEVLAATEAA